jgi:hypothetical protein
MLRVARPTDNLAAVAEMYRRGMGFALLGAFSDHDGFDGIMLGHPGAAYHLEFTALKTLMATGWLFKTRLGDGDETDLKQTRLPAVKGAFLL